jgi:hypothetical protein
MTVKQEEKQRSEEGKPNPALAEAVIARYVMAALGQPGDLHRVDVRRLWDNRFRVNVFVGGDAASARVANSYFLVADGSGNIIESRPEITRQY